MEEWFYKWEDNSRGQFGLEWIEEIEADSINLVDWLMEMILL